MNIELGYLLDKNFLIKKYLREHSNYYKNLIRNPSFVWEIMELMKKEYHLTLPDKLERIKNNISLVSGFMDVLK